MRGFLGLALALAIAAPVVGQDAAAPDRLEQLMWQGALSANTPGSYGVYLRRYPTGAFAPLARENLVKLGGTAPVPASASSAVVASPPSASVAPSPVVAPPPVAPLPAATQAAPATPVAVALPVPAPVPAAQATTPLPSTAADAGTASPLFLCRPLFASGSAPLDRAGEAELASYLEATRINSLDAYRRYLAAWPQGLFAPEVAALVETRTARANGFAATPIPGPHPARLRRPLEITPGDYPAQALRAGQAGAVEAVWEIGEDGCVQSCRIEKSSGSPALDAATCRTITVRGRYDPARDGAGKPIRAVASTTITWTIPK